MTDVAERVQKTAEQLDIPRSVSPVFVTWFEVFVTSFFYFFPAFGYWYNLRLRVTFGPNVYVSVPQFSTKKRSLLRWRFEH